MYKCYKCGTPVITERKPGFQDVCEGCGSYLHCCLNCRFYDTDGNRCTEPTADWVGDRHSFNRCEYFQVDRPKRPEKPTKREGTEEEDGRRFRKPDWRNVRKQEKPVQRGPRDGGEKDRARDARRSLDDLFRKPGGPDGG